MPAPALTPEQAGPASHQPGPPSRPHSASIEGASPTATFLVVGDVGAELRPGDPTDAVRSDRLAWREGTLRPTRQERAASGGGKASGSALPYLPHW